MNRAWILNLDAERELARPDRGADPFAALEKRPHLVDALAALVGDDAVVARTRTRGAVQSVVRGFAWCPTPSALSACARAGIAPPRAPGVDVLSRVNHRAFCADLGPTLDQSRFITTVEDALAWIGRPSPSGTWLMKRPLGFAGHGRAVAPPIDQAVKTFVARSVTEEGGVQIEPLVERLLDISLHGHLSETGTLTVGVPTVQVLNAFGAWRSTRRAQPGEVTAEERSALDREIVLVGAALERAGYFGPFGIDAFRYARGAGSALQPRCEINARYTMGWAEGMHGVRPDLA